MNKFFDWIPATYEILWKAIIRPPKDDYDESELGPPLFSLRGVHYSRTDFEITNPRGLLLQCSHYEPVQRLSPRLPCVIYLHGNASSRVEAISSLTTVLPLGMTLVCMDFSACGHSEGEYISLGWHEQADLAELIDHLRESRAASTVAVWGRSMGAVTALMHAAKDPTVSGIVCDSAFSNLRQLCEELVSSFISVTPPKMAVNFALNRIKATVQQKANFDMDALIPLNSAPLATAPAFFISADDDVLVNPRHTRVLLEKYGGPAMFTAVDGDHNTARDSATMNQIGSFLFNALQCELLFGEKGFPSAALTLPPLPPLYKSQMRGKKPQGSISSNHLQRRLSSSGPGPQSVSDVTEAPTPVADVEDKQVEPPDTFCLDSADNGVTSIGLRMVHPQREPMFQHDRSYIE